jgi:chromosome partitioning protein
VTDVLAVANQKGGVAKTTTVHSLGVAAAEDGRRTLVIDLDPQACLTYSLGFDPDALGRSLHDVFVQRAGLAEVILPVPGVACLDLVPATIDLAGSEVHLLTRTGREHVLERALGPVLDRYELVLIDCPPSLGVLTINGLTAANSVVIPLQCEALSHRGVGQLLETIEDVRTFANSTLSVRGIIATMYDDRTRHARHIMEEVEARYRIPVLQPPVRKSIRFAEAPARGKSILQHAPSSPGAVAYRQLARTILESSAVAGPVA